MFLIQGAYRIFIGDFQDFPGLFGTDFQDYSDLFPELFIVDSLTDGGRILMVNEYPI